jgi:transcription initiation factor TFIID subunit 5
MESHGKPQGAETFFDKFKSLFERNYEDDLRALSLIRLPAHVQENETAQLYRKNKYRVYLSTAAYANLVQYLESKEKESGTLIIYVISQYLEVHTIERGTDDSLSSILTACRRDEDLPVEGEGIPGHKVGLASAATNGSVNSTPLKLGPLPTEPDLIGDVRAELEEEDSRNPPDAGQNTLLQEYDALIKREESEDAPSRNEVPLPPSLARDVVMEVQKVKENRDRLRIDTRSGGVGPSVSVCMYTFHNTFDA